MHFDVRETGRRTRARRSVSWKPVGGELAVLVGSGQSRELEGVRRGFRDASLNYPHLACAHPQSAARDGVPISGFRHSRGVRAYGRSHACAQTST